jgi:6-pyruvoyl-tetrahydropterin synthase
MFTIEYLSFFKFNSAHFIAHGDWREPLHGHNYKVSLEVNSLNVDKNTEEIIKEGELSRVTTDICNSLKHRLLLGSNNDNCIFEDLGENIKLTLKCDGTSFTIPKSDVKFIDTAQASAECLAEYISKRIIEKKKEFIYDGVNYHSLIVKVYEDERKFALFRTEIN